MPAMPMCIRCGRETSILIDGRLCPDCFLDLYGFGVAPKRLEVTVCPRCGSYKFQGRWFPSSGDLEDVVALVFQAAFKPNEYTEYYRVETVDIDYENEKAIVTVVGKLRGDDKERSMTYAVDLRIKKQLCPVCMRKASGAPTAIIQVRSHNGRLGSEERLLVEELLADLDSGLQEAIISTNEVKEGLDINLLDQNIARVIANRFRSKLGALIKESHKLITQRRDGKRVTRLTLSVRLPFFTPGALIDYKGGLARVEEIDKGYVIIRLLGTNKYKRLRVEEAWKTLQKPKHIERSNVVIAALEPGWIHLQETSGAYNYIEIPKRDVLVEGSIKPGTEATLIKYNNKYYIVGKNN
ncbi:60S ribosomal export protein NMD3 [Pyrofollis japonicus]|nr:60S ribosomal export protein NMD3 [Pyrofollis japonicus]